MPKPMQYNLQVATQILGVYIPSMDVRAALSIFSCIQVILWLQFLVVYSPLGRAEVVDPPYSVSMPTIPADGFWNLYANASYNGSSILLNPSAAWSFGLALSQKQFTLLRENDSFPCEVASFEVSFSFKMYDFVDNGDGMSLNLLGGNLDVSDYIRDARSSYFGFKYSTDDAKNVGGFAVEYDTFTNAVDEDISSPHVGIDLNYSLESVIAENVTNVNLVDETVKYTWIDYDGGIQILSIFISGVNTKPDSPLIRYSLNLCDILRPSTCNSSCQNVTSAYFIIGGYCGAAYAAHELLSFNLNTSWNSGTRYDDVAIPYSQNSTSMDTSEWNLYGNAINSTSSIVLTPSVVSQTGIAIFKKRITILNGSGSICEASSFQISFSFKISNPSTESFGEGISIVILSPTTDIPNYVNFIGTLGFSKSSQIYPLYGVAVELDSVRNFASFKSNINNYLTNQRLSEANVTLSDTSIKYAWIVHDRSSRTLSLFIGSNASQPELPFMTTTIDLCSLLRPQECSKCQLATSAYVVLASTTNDVKFASHEILSFAVNTSWESVSTGLHSPPPSVSSPSVSSPPMSPPPTTGVNYALIGGSIGGSVVLLIIIVAIVCHCWNVKFSRHLPLHATKLTVPTISGEVVDVGDGRFTRRFTLGEISAATNNFSEELIIGKGGFGCVYVGTFSEGEKWAVKQSRQRIFGDEIKTFETEVKLIACVSHGNLVALKGFCDEGGEQILVYELVSNGNLRQCIEGQAKTGNEVMSMEDRIRIATGAARGLDYLHHFEKCPIIHCDVKSENILIGEHLTAKVSDFGLLKSLDAAKTHVSADVMGTLGYLDPEYVKTMKVSTKSDVYSFGVVLLELVTGRRCNFVSPIENDGDELIYESLVSWARRTWDADNLMDFVDPLLGSNYHPDIVNRVVQLALHCTKLEGKMRPSMRDVLNILEEVAHENRVMSGLEGSKFVLGDMKRESGSIGSSSSNDGVYPFFSQDQFSRGSNSFWGAPVSVRPVAK